MLPLQVASVVSDSVRPHRRQPIRLPRLWDSPGKNTGVGCHFLLQRMKVKSESEVTQSCPTLSDPMDCSLPASSVHGIFQARVLEWGAIASSQTYKKNWDSFKYVISTNHKLTIERSVQVLSPEHKNFKKINKFLEILMSKNVYICWPYQSFNQAFWS